MIGRDDNGARQMRSGVDLRFCGAGRMQGGIGFKAM